MKNVSVTVELDEGWLVKINSWFWAESATNLWLLLWHTGPVCWTSLSMQRWLSCEIFLLEIAQKTLDKYFE